jgi:hypothetical protein
MVSMAEDYKLMTEYNAGFGWQFTLYKNGALSIRRGTYQTEGQARQAGFRLMSHRLAPTKFSFEMKDAHG